MLPIFNPDELLARLGGSPADLSRLIPALRQSIAAWQRDLPAALAANDPERLRRVAHQAKGALLTFAAPHAASRAQAIEDRAGDGDPATLDSMVRLLLDAVDQLQVEVATLLPGEPAG